MASTLTIGDLSILLIEPSHAQRKIIVRYLVSAGLNNIETAETGEQALSLIGVRQPDLVVSAMYYDDMTGSDLVTRLRAETSTENLPFMLISSESHPHNLEAVRQAGVLAILPKPFELDDLKRALYASLDYIEPDEIDLARIEVEDLRVLVVDDSQMSLNHICHILEQMGVEKIVRANNGREAAEHVLESAFDLVVTDYNMPEMDGQELVHYIRQLSGQPDIPILMVTSEKDSARLASVKQAGVSALCDKPFDPRTLRTLIQRLLAA